VRVLVTGASGQLGTGLALHCSDVGDEVVACDRSRLDLSDRDSVYQAILSARPDVVVNAGAWTAVDACESDPERAFRVNALGARWVADASRRAEAHLVHVSTDYVFDGTKDGPYLEWDAPGPRSVYGRSKLGGEQEVASHAPGSTVVRTAWVCGAHGRNMVTTVLGLRDRPELAFVDDQRGSPSFTADLAPVIRRLAAGRVPGLFHLTNAGSVTWYEFVRDILELGGGDPQRVRPIRTAELDPPRPAPRPANSVLDNAALRLSGVELLPDFREPLARTVAWIRAHGA
jgi:dTDP-4-dehydrorhamnose reductase